MKETVYRISAGVRLSIALIADTHNVDPSSILSSLRTYQPELICITGDLLIGHRPDDENLIVESQENVLPLVSGCVDIAPTFISLGNHEWMISPEDIEVLNSTGAVVLDNGFTSLNISGGGVDADASAAVDVDVTGFTSDIITNADIVLYDADGNQVDTSQISMNAKTVNVNITIYGTKYVPLKFTVKGEPANGYALTGQIDANPEQVLIAGKNSTISSVKEITIDDVAVVVHIESVSEETFDVDIRNISIASEVDGYNAEIDESEYDTVSLTLTGLTSVLENVSANSLKGTVDLDSYIQDNGELADGTYSMEVDFDLPDGVKATNTASVYVIVEKKE